MVIPLRFYYALTPWHVVARFLPFLPSKPVAIALIAAVEQQTVLNRGDGL